MYYRNSCSQLHKMSMRILDLLTVKSYGENVAFGKLFILTEKYQIGVLYRSWGILPHFAQTTNSPCSMSRLDGELVGCC